MSLSRSDTDRSRPADHVDQSDTTDTVSSPPLGLWGYIRWGWRQLTSMRTAIVLLLLLALAAVPGSVFPQRSADPNGVTQWFRNNPEAAPVLDWFQLFDLYSSSWFSAIYLLLFVSLIGCVIPRTRHHLKALRAAPPRTPARLSRLEHYYSVLVDGGSSPEASATDAIAIATDQMRSRGYRVKRYDAKGTWSVSAERGYARETGNLAFHVALIGVLVSVLLGSGFTYTGQRVIVEGTTFVNALSDYSSFNPGRFIDGTELTPYSMTLDAFDVQYVPPGSAGAGQAGDFAAAVTVRTPGTVETLAETVRVNSPLTVSQDRIFLLGNGYAPTITVRNAEGNVVYSDAQPFLPQDSMMTSLGIIKVPDGLPEQVGLVGFFYPTQGALSTGAYASIYPDLFNPVVTFNVFSGDLGIDDGTPRSVYTLDTSGMAQLTGGETGGDSIELGPGQTADLPNGWGTVTFEDASAGTDPLGTVKRFASLQIQHDPGATWVLLFAMVATVGLMAGLFIPRRRLWVKATLDHSGKPHTLRLEYAGLARGEDPQLPPVVLQLRDAHLSAIQTSTPSPTSEEDA